MNEDVRYECCCRWTERFARAARERDEARAEVARLDAEIERLRDQLTAALEINRQLEERLAWM